MSTYDDAMGSIFIAYEMRRFELVKKWEREFDRRKVQHLSNATVWFDGGRGMFTDFHIFIDDNYENIDRNCFVPIYCFNDIVDEMERYIVDFVTLCYCDPDLVELCTRSYLEWRTACQYFQESEDKININRDFASNINKAFRDFRDEYSNGSKEHLVDGFCKFLDELWNLMDEGPELVKLFSKSQAYKFRHFTGTALQYAMVVKIE